MVYRIDSFVGEIGRRLVRWSQRDSNYLKHAHSEWRNTFSDDDQMQNAMGENVFDMVAMFGLAGHSGFSAKYAQNYVEKALKFEPFSPLTGDESEWGDPYCSEGIQQNKRCSHVFRGADGRAYDIEGRIFRDNDGSCFTSRDSRVYIDFPYIPKREYVDVEQ